MLRWIAKRCKQASGQNTLTFGGINVILISDIAQLPAMTDKVLYYCKPNGQLATEGFCMYHKFDKVVKFTVNQRAQGDSIDQEDFRNLLVNARDGNTTVDEWITLLAKAPDKIPNLDQFEQQAIK